MTSIFEPLVMGEITLKNRIVMAPMTRGRAGDSRVPNELMADYYYQRASAGLLITEATVISEEGIGWIGSPGIYNTAMVDGWKRITEKVASAQSHMFLQLWHCGRASHSDFHNGKLPVSASAVKLNGDKIHTPFGKKEYEVPRPLTQEEIAATVNDYRRAAENAREAGFSGIEVHAANGYLINQFLDSRTNLRSDRYGGSVENRFRFLGEVLDAVMTVWPSSRVAVRISPNGIFNDMGSPDFRETYRYVAAELNGFNLGYLHIMDGLGFGFHEQGDPMDLAEFRSLYKGIIMGNCGYTPEDGRERVERGLADLVAYGRPYISNPDLVERFKNGWPLNPSDDMTYWYTSGAQGYSDYRSYPQPE